MMGLRLFRSRAASVSASAPVARERLQILLAHERGLRGQPDLLELLRSEILAVVSRHIAFDPEKLNIKMERGNDVSTLEIDIEVPNTSEAWTAAVA
jgi:cell division topological specificity factor